jgi:hypothetical protein
MTGQDVAEKVTNIEPTAQLAVLLVRGVGEAKADETLGLLEGVLADYGIPRTFAREVNWSWTESVAWPTGVQRPRRRPRFHDLNFYALWDLPSLIWRTCP